MSLAIEIAVRHRLGDFELDASFVSNGRLTALFGRSGSGKTSLVNVVAGLIAPDSGRVVIDGEVLVDTSAGIFVPKHKRRIGYVFQDARLFPHLTVRQNLMFGRWFARGERGASESERDAVLGLLGIGHLLARRPAGLSGGERQRVAIGRALLARPRMLLMDEPLASLDEARKAEILPYIERLRDESRIPIIYVSHSVHEVARLATTLTVIDQGKVIASGPMAETISGSDIFGQSGASEACSVLEGSVTGHDAEYSLTSVTTVAGVVQLAQTSLPLGASVRMRILARDVLLSLPVPTGLSALNILPGVVVEIGPKEAGPLLSLRLTCNGATLNCRLTAKSVADMGLAPGSAVHAVIKTAAIEIL